MDLGVLALALRVVLLIVAAAHIVEGIVPRTGVAWRLPLVFHLREVAPTLVSFGFAAVVLVTLESRWGAALAMADAALLSFVLLALMIPPLNAVDGAGIVIAGRRYGWDRYLSHVVGPYEDGYARVVLSVSVWKYMSRRRFRAPPEVVREFERLVRQTGDLGRRRGPAEVRRGP